MKRTPLFFCMILLYLGLSASQANAEALFKAGVYGDIRTGFFENIRHNRDGSRVSTDGARLRARAGLKAGIGENWEARIRLAGRYTSASENQLHSRFFENIPNSDGLRLGDSTIDELYLLFSPNEKWQLKLGRFQAKFELEGVARKGLSRNDSPNTEITWTDGLHAAVKLAPNWKAHLIVQRNTHDGSTTVRRRPLNFSNTPSLATYFIALEKNDNKATVSQISIDVTFLPKTLHSNGVGASTNDQIQAYWGFTSRLAIQSAPAGQRRGLFGLEIGYAPNTPGKAAISLDGNGDSLGLAWQISLNAMDIFAGHHLGIVYMQSRGGWLLSPDISNNQHFIETRYRWSISKKHRIEARIRKRYDLFQQAGSPYRRNDLNSYVRYTMKF